MINWKDYLEEQVKEGLSLHWTRQKRGYNLFWTGANRHADGMFEVRQGMSALNGDKRQFRVFNEAYEWLIDGTPINTQSKGA